jgi:4-hydroxy-tetrahydrodipicolinate reductase
VSANIIINGAGGRMGREIAAIAFTDPAVTVAGCVDLAAHPSSGQDMGVLCGVGARGVAIRADMAALDLEHSTVIDFSSPASTVALAGILSTRGSRMVVGTTGLTENDILALRKAATSIPVLFSPNMSLGVNLLFHLTEIAAARLAGQFDIEIIEAHHHHKKDSPSGTARKLGEIAAAALGRSYGDAVVDGRSGMVGERPRNEIGMHAVRGGDIVGDHTVLFAGNGERVELKHVAHSRATFAQGAVTAAKWLSGREPGFYSMRDVLGI